MLPAPTPPDEAARLTVLRTLKILDTAPEERFDAITRFAKDLFQVPIALISLVDHDRQWFKSKVGLDAGETARSVSFCGHAILSPMIFVVENALVNPKFADNPLVTGFPHVVFYAGMPLTVSGFRVGTLCLIDHEPRTFDGRNRHLLQQLAAWAERELGVQSDFQTLAKYAEAQRENEERIRAIVENIVDGIISIDEGGTIETVNSAVEQIFGYQQRELIGRNIKMLMPEPHRSQHDQYVANYIATGVAKVIGKGREVSGLRKDGSMFPMELAVSVTQVNGRRTFTGVVRDISERKRVEQMKSEFISTVSHELRTPLTSIRGALGLVVGGFAGEIPQQARELVVIAHNNSERLVHLINDILDMEKIEANRMALELHMADVGALLKTSVADIAGYAIQHNVTIDLEESPSLLVNVDHGRIQQVLANLLSNAIKFAPGGGRVVVRATPMEQYVRISVTDHGPGIPEEFRSRIFGKFAQADASDTRQKGGTGLGLSISKAIVERHGGTIGFAADPGSGTTFFFDLPLSSQHAASAPVAEAECGKHRILICEDDHDIARLLAMILSQGGFLTEVAHTAGEAKQKLAQQSFTAMTLDLALPDQDGISLIRELREELDTRDIPIIVVSATAQQGKRQINGDAFGIVDWLEKPIDEERLRSRLKAAVRHAPTGKPRILHIEDDPDVFAVTAALIGDEAILVSARTLEEAIQLLSQETFDLVLLDLSLPDGSGEQVLPLLRERDSATPVIVFSAQDLPSETVARVERTLVKSRTTNAELLQIIQSYISRADAGSTVCQQTGNRKER